MNCGLYNNMVVFSPGPQATGGRLVFDVDGKPFLPMPVMQGEEWRTVRHALTPAFSGRKMKLVSESTPVLVNHNSVSIKLKRDPTNGTSCLM